MRVGLNLASIGVPAGWWLAAARLAEEAGFSGAWIWDHFLSRGRRTDPVLECWTTLAAAAVATRSIHLGSFVTNVMNRHPSVLARMAANVQDLAGGRLEVGIGIGGHPREHEALGIPFPPAAERVARLEEAVQVLRLLWSGGPVSFEGRYYQLRDAYAHPVPQPSPRLVIGGETAAGAQLAARLGDAWTTTGEALLRDRTIFEDALAAAGRRLARTWPSWSPSTSTGTPRPPRSRSSPTWLASWPCGASGAPTRRSSPRCARSSSCTCWPRASVPASTRRARPPDVRRGPRYAAR